jgi:hypothetical protein
MTDRTRQGQKPKIQLDAASGAAAGNKQNSPTSPRRRLARPRVTLRSIARHQYKPPHSVAAPNARLHRQPTLAPLLLRLCKP